MVVAYFSTLLIFWSCKTGGVMSKQFTFLMSLDESGGHLENWKEELKDGAGSDI